MKYHKFHNCRIVFVGCVKEGKECLQEILDVGGNVIAIFTFTDDLAEKTSGAASFEDVSQKYEIPLYKVKSTNTSESIDILKKLIPDVIFVIGWTRLVSRSVLNIPKYGCIGMHASLLPKYRGRAPVNWALINNESQTGNSVILLDEGVDTGKLLAQQRIPINLSDTCKTLYDKVAKAGKVMLREIIPSLEQGFLQQVPQNDEEASVMPKRTPEDGLIEWGKTSLELFNWVRAITYPYPGAFTYFRNKKFFIWEVRITHYSSIDVSQENWTNVPGTIVSISDGIVVLTGKNELLSIHKLNYEDEKEQGWQDFLSSNELTVGDVLG